MAHKLPLYTINGEIKCQMAQNGVHKNEKKDFSMICIQIQSQIQWGHTGDLTSQKKEHPLARLYPIVCRGHSFHCEELQSV